MNQIGDAFQRLTGMSPGLVAAATAIAATLSATDHSDPGRPAGPGPGSTPDARPVTAAALLDALILVHWAQTELSAAEHTLIDAARQAGVSWQTIAPAVGVTSRQAAERRFLRLAPAVAEAASDADPTYAPRQGPGGTGTRDGRVRAERDRRAGQRAVARWANDNTADLRRLAGQITAVPDLNQAADPDINRLHEALADTDAVALPHLLANTRRHLTGHPELTDQIDAVTAHTTQVRDDTQRRRDS